MAKTRKNKGGTNIPAHINQLLKTYYWSRLGHGMRLADKAFLWTLIIRIQRKYLLLVTIPTNH